MSFARRQTPRVVAERAGSRVVAALLAECAARAAPSGRPRVVRRGASEKKTPLNREGATVVRRSCGAREQAAEALARGADDAAVTRADARRHTSSRCAWCRGEGRRGVGAALPSMTSPSRWGGRRRRLAAHRMQEPPAGHGHTPCRYVPPPPCRCPPPIPPTKSEPQGLYVAFEASSRSSWGHTALHRLSTIRHETPSCNATVFRGGSA